MNLKKSVLWTGGELTLWEVCRLFESEEENRLRGTVVGRLEGEVLEVRYDLTCTRDWRTRELELECRRETGSLQLILHADSESRWTDANKELIELRGLLDIDLGISPSTNTLPIRRLKLAIGESKELTAVWVKFPGLEIQPLPQRYTRTAENQYLYESAGGRFRAELEVDEFGLVKKYGEYWTAVTV